MKNQRPQQNNNQYIILDTSIIKYSRSKNKPRSEAVLQTLRKLLDKNYRLAISEYTVYESFRGAQGRQIDEISSALKPYEKKSVSFNVLGLASLLFSLYREEQIEVTDGDQIIAATAILEKGLILTRNHKDFPSPFFVPKDFLVLRIDVGRYTEHLDLALYEPHFALIKRRISRMTNKESH